ncbi:MAG: GNAT family N-acetyltransferase [Bacteroidetes bacterium]|nr:GNAT family N-acetyltransferase [Bacteroidota bacterium]MCL2303099.1 GNAT family N-acetyltransferase [Lentimicrobiaceae bacterium]
MHYKKAIVTDIPEIKSLWEETFGDAKGYINRFITHFGIATCYVCEVNHKIIAMAFALPTTLKSPSNFEGVSGEAGRGSLYKMQYIYACATHPNYQRQGIMQNLLATIYDAACRENIAGIFLHAADQNLANYYRKLGFEDFFYRNHFWYYKDKLLATVPVPTNTIKFISPETYQKKRVQKLENNSFVNWNEDFFRFINEGEIQLCAYESAIFSYKTGFNNIIVDELLGDVSNEEIARLLIEHFPDIETVHIRLPGAETCCGQVKWCKHWEKQPEDGYFAFAME